MKIDDLYLKKLHTEKDIVRLVQIRQWYKETGKQVLWTNGVFDLFHAGHSRFLIAAAQLIGRNGGFFVGVNSDWSTKQLKGPSRPILSEQHRAEILCSLGCIRQVVIFNTLTTDDLILRIQPDIVCHGQKTGTLKEKQAVESYGGKIIYLPLTEGISTTEIIRRCREAPE